MGENFILALAAVLAVSLLSLAGLVALGMSTTVLRKVMPIMVSVAVGALFGDAIVHLIPHALADVQNEAVVPFFVLFGIVMFFSLEKFLRWQHSHDLPEELEVDLAHGGHDHHDHPIKPVGPIILVGDGLHNFLDGIIIGTSFLISPEVGIATTIAVALHEIPQEIGDFAILLHAGYSKKKALLFNFLSAMAAVLGLVLVYMLADIQGLTPILSAIAAGGFIYIAGSDLVPHLHEQSTSSEHRTSESAKQLIAMLVGMGLMFALLEMEGSHSHGHDHGHNHGHDHEVEHEHVEDPGDEHDHDDHAHEEDGHDPAHEGEHEDHAHEEDGHDDHDH